MGHIQKRGDRKYQARWLDPEGRERAQTFSRKVDAERHLASVEGAKLQGTYVDRSNMITVSEYAKQWAATRAPSGNHRGTHRDVDQNPYRSHPARF